MMKKLNISSQLFLIFVFVILVASCLFSVIELTAINFTAENQVYSRLSTYSLLLNSTRYAPGESETSLSYDDMTVEYVIHKKSFSGLSDLNYKSANINQYLSEEKLNDVINGIAEKLAEFETTNNQPEAVRVQGNTKNGSTTIFFVCQIDRWKTGDSLDSTNYAIAFTSNIYTTNLVKTLSLQLIIVFFTLVVLAMIIIYLWSRRFVKRINLLQDHIINLPKNKYKQKYIDDSVDEIGQLSESVETMRTEIAEIEQTKQDMLQNLSHDFKTPIAVIRSYAEAIQDGIESTEALSIIIEQSEILKNKVTKLLQYNSLEYLDKSKEFEEINMKELVEEVVLSYKYQTNLNFNLDLEDGVIFMGYRENWSTVISNIIDNAKRYAKTEIKIVLRTGRIRIYNDGEHIDEQFMNSIFKPYEKGSKGQFGLGMSIVMKTVDFFGMNLKVKNEDPIGVSFIIEDPKRDM